MLNAEMRLKLEGRLATGILGLAVPVKEWQGVGSVIWGAGANSKSLSR
jgi:hypothetical protein